MNVVAVGAANVSSTVAPPDDAGGDSFLTVVQMDKPKHFASIVHFLAHLFKRAP